MLCELLGDAPQSLTVRCEAPDLVSFAVVLIRNKSLGLPLNALGTLPVGWQALERGSVPKSISNH